MYIWLYISPWMLECEVFLCLWCLMEHGRIGRVLLSLTTNVLWKKQLGILVNSRLKFVVDVDGSCLSTVVILMIYNLTLQIWNQLVNILFIFHGMIGSSLNMDIMKWQLRKLCHKVLSKTLFSFEFVWNATLQTWLHCGIKLNSSNN